MQKIAKKREKRGKKLKNRLEFRFALFRSENNSSEAKRKIRSENKRKKRSEIL
jgi:hypothetical protein